MIEIYNFLRYLYEHTKNVIVFDITKIFLNTYTCNLIRRISIKNKHYNFISLLKIKYQIALSQLPNMQHSRKNHDYLTS